MATTWARGGTSSGASSRLRLLLDDETRCSIPSGERGPATGAPVTTWDRGRGVPVEYRGTVTVRSVVFPARDDTADAMKNANKTDVVRTANTEGDYKKKNNKMFHDAARRWGKKKNNNNSNESGTVRHAIASALEINSGPHTGKQRQRPQRTEQICRLPPPPRSSPSRNRTARAEDR